MRPPARSRGSRSGAATNQHQQQQQISNHNQKQGPSSAGFRQNTLSLPPLPPHRPPPTEDKENATPKIKEHNLTLPANIIDMFDEAKQYQQLLDLEHQIDQKIMLRRIKNESLIKQPLIISKRIRIFVSHVYHRLHSATQIPKWELRIEGRLTDDCSPSDPTLPPSHQSTLEKLISNKTNKRFSDFFSIVSVELDPTLYGTTQNVIVWKRDPASPTDGCVIARNGDSDIPIRIRFWRYNDPQKYKIHPYVAKILGLAYGTKTSFVEALFLYVKTHKLQDPHAMEWINCDYHFQLIFGVARLKINELSLRIQSFFLQFDPIVIEHTIRVADDVKPMIACYEFDVEISETFHSQTTSFLESFEKTINNDNLKISNIISRIKRSKELYDATTRFANDPANALHDIIKSQSADLQTMKETFSGREPSKHFEYYLHPNMKEGVDRYLFNKVAQKRAELETNLCVKK
uniref:DM2 domain-containing protein n=1 Tax=Panagrolaimus superbus TaxID=310955 RepID=A0A914Z6U4_9BILA